MLGWLAAAAVALATVPAMPGLASAAAGVGENPNLAAVPAGKVIWTQTPQMPFFVNVPSGMAQPSVTYGGAPVALASSAPSQGGGGTSYQYSVSALPNTPPQSLSVSYSVYQDSALVGVDQSIFEMGPPSPSTVSFTLFAHGGGTVSTGSIQVNYNGTPVSVTPTANANGSATVAFNPSGGVTTKAGMQVTWSDTQGNQYQGGGPPSTDAQWLAGFVKDSGGNPVGGVQVQAFMPGGSGSGMAFTGADGSFVVPLPATGSYQVVVNPQGLPYVQQQTTVTVAAGANALATVTLAAPAATVTGVVYDGTTGQPLANAFVNMFEQVQVSSPTGPGPGSPPPGGQAMTDAAGVFSIALPSLGTYGMNVQPPFKSNPDNLGTFSATEKVATSSLNVPVTLQQANATVTGTVTALGAPVANTPVNLIELNGSGFAFGQTDPSGHYAIPVGAGTWMLQLFGQTATGQPLQTLDMSQTVTPSADLSGGQLVIGSGTGQTVTDNVYLRAYDVPLDVAVTVGGAAPAKAFAFATQGAAPGGPGAGPAGPGLFADPSMNSDGTPGDYATTGHLHLYLTAGTWQVGAGVKPPTGGMPIVRQFTVTITGSGASAAIKVVGRGVSLTAGAPPLVTAALAAHNQVITVSVNGSVGGVAGQPIANAMVGAFNDNGDFIPGDGNPPQTGSNGQDTIHVSKGQWNVVVMAPGYGMVPPEQVDTTTGAGAYTATVNLGAQLPYTISGSVTANGSPLAGVQVFATQAGQSPVGTITDPTGAYTMNVGSGVWALTVHTRQLDTSGIAPVDSPSMSAGTQTATVNLDVSAATQRSATLSGTVYEPDGATPLANATVSASLPSQPGMAPVTAVTASDGSWEIPVSAGTWSITAVAPGYLPSAAQSVTATSGTTAGIDLTVGATLPDTLTGSVTDAGGNAIAGAMVTAVDPATQAVFQALTGSDGTYAIAVADGSYTLHVHAAGYTDALSPAAEPASGGSTATENFQLSSGQVVSGTVTVAGTAAGGVEVDAVNSTDASEIVTTTTDASGAYTLNLTAGAWSLTAYSPVAKTTSNPVSVTVTSAPLSAQDLSIQ